MPGGICGDIPELAMGGGGHADGPRQATFDSRIPDLLHSLGIEINTGDVQHLRDGMMRLSALHLQKQDTGTAALSRMSAATAMLRASLRAASQAGWLVDQERAQQQQHSSAAVQIKAEVISDGSLVVQRIKGPGVTGELVQVYRFVYTHTGATELYFIVDDSVVLAGYGFDTPEVQRSVSGMCAAACKHPCAACCAPVGRHDAAVLSRVTALLRRQACGLSAQCPSAHWQQRA